MQYKCRGGNDSCPFLHTTPYNNNNNNKRIIIVRTIYCVAVTYRTRGFAAKRVSRSWTSVYIVIVLVLCIRYTSSFFRSNPTDFFAQRDSSETRDFYFVISYHVRLDRFSPVGQSKHEDTSVVTTTTTTIIAHCVSIERVTADDGQRSTILYIYQTRSRIVFHSTGM